MHLFKSCNYGIMKRDLKVYFSKVTNKNKFLEGREQKRQERLKSPLRSISVTNDERDITKEADWRVCKNFNICAELSLSYILNKERQNVNREKMLIALMKLLNKALKFLTDN